MDDVFEVHATLTLPRSVLRNKRAVIMEGATEIEKALIRNNGTNAFAMQDDKH